MKKALSVALVLTVILSCLCVIGTAGAEKKTMWVKTETGNGIRARIGPGYNYEIVGTIPYGQKLTVYGYDGDWAILSSKWNTSFSSKADTFVPRKYLVFYDPGKYKGSTTPDSGSHTVPDPGRKTDIEPSPTILTDSALGSETVEGLNAQYRGFDYIKTPYTMLVVPDTRTGTARLRWAPSKHSTLITQLPANYALTVLATNASWAMVKDPSSDKIGYIAIKFLRYE